MLEVSKLFVVLFLKTIYFTAICVNLSINLAPSHAWNDFWYYSEVVTAFLRFIKWTSTNKNMNYVKVSLIHCTLLYNRL